MAKATKKMPMKKMAKKMVKKAVAKKGKMTFEKARAKHFGLGK